jgi:hypothetical protein
MKKTVILIAMLACNCLAGSARYDGQNTVIQGRWKMLFGSKGACVFGFPNKLPDYAKIKGYDYTAYCWNANGIDDPVALQDPVFGSTKRTARCFYNDDSLSLNIQCLDDHKHQISIYCMDYDRVNRAQRIDIIDLATKKVLDSRVLTEFGSGVYLVWTVSGYISIKITNLRGPSAVISGVFFD